MKKIALSSSVIFLFSLYILVIPSPAAIVLQDQPKRKTAISADVVKSEPIAQIPAVEVFVPVVLPTPKPVKKPVVSLPANSNPPPVPVPVSVQQPPVQPQTPPPAPSSKYRDGVFVGAVADAYYGNVQIQATISGGKITDVKFLQYPSDRGTSVRINTGAMPYLISEAIQAQSASVDIVSGATETSGAFQQSLGSALSQALI